MSSLPRPTTPGLTRSSPTIPTLREILVVPNLRLHREFLLADSPGASTTSFPISRRGRSVATPPAWTLPRPAVPGPSSPPTATRLLARAEVPLAIRRRGFLWAPSHAAWMSFCLTLSGVGLGAEMRRAWLLHRPTASPFSPTTPSPSSPPRPTTPTQLAAPFGPRRRPGFPSEPSRAASPSSWATLSGAR